MNLIVSNVYEKWVSPIAERDRKIVSIDKYIN